MLTRTSSSASSMPIPIVSDDVDGREDDRADERVPEDLVVQDGAVVREPDVDALVPDQLEEPVALQRELDQPVERVAEDHRDHDDDRRDQAVRHGPAAGPGPETASPPRPLMQGLGGGVPLDCLRAPVTAG